MCIICSLTKDDFEKASVTLQLHQQDTHYLWNYLDYMIGLIEVSKSEMNGSDIEIHKKIQNGDLSWFPLHRTTLLQKATEEKDHLEARVRQLTQKIESFCLSRLT